MLRHFTYSAYFRSYPQTSPIYSNYLLVCSNYSKMAKTTSMLQSKSNIQWRAYNTKISEEQEALLEADVSEVRREPLVGSSRLKTRKSQAQEKLKKKPTNTHTKTPQPWVNNRYSDSTKPYRSLRMSKKLDRKTEVPVPISTITDDGNFKSIIWNK